MFSANDWLHVDSSDCFVTCETEFKERWLEGTVVMF